MCCTWRRSSRSWDKDMVAVRRIKWKTSMWTQQYWIYLCLSLFKLQFIVGKDYTENLRSTKNQPLKSLKQFFTWLEGWSRITQKLLNWPRLTDSNSCGERLLCKLTKLFNSQLPEPTSFLTQCFVWEVSVTNHSKPWKAGLNDFWKHVISKISIGSTGSRWSSSGNFPRISLHWEFSTKFKRWSLDHSVNQSNWKEGSSSCQCTMTLFEQDEEVKQIVLRILSGLLSMLEDSRKDIGRFWCLDPRRNGTEPMSTNRMENGRKLLKAWCSTLPKADILYFVPAAPWKEEFWKAKEKEWKPFTSTAVMKPLK